MFDNVEKVIGVRRNGLAAMGIGTLEAPLMAPDTPDTLPSRPRSKNFAANIGVVLCIASMAGLCYLLIFLLCSDWLESVHRVLRFIPD